MQSFFDRRAPTLDTAQPSIRHIQDLIRREAPVAIRMGDGHEFAGVLRWQDLQYFALDQGDARPLVLINRHAVSVLRSLT